MTTITHQREERGSVRIERDIVDHTTEFLVDRRCDVLAMHEAIDQNDFEAIRTLSLIMKGAGGYGFDTITKIGGALEQAAKKKDATEVLAQVDALSALLNRMKMISE